MGRGAWSGSTLPPAGWSSLTASSTLEALAHSNAFIGSSSLLGLHQAVEDLVGGDGKVADAHAAGVVDRVGDCADARHVGRLRHADHHLALIAVVDDRHELRNFHRPRQLVVAEARIEHDAHLAVHHAALEEGHAHRLDHAAVDLAFERDAVERQPAVLHMAHFDDANFAGLDVDFDLGERDAVDAASRQPRLPLP